MASLNIIGEFRLRNFAESSNYAEEFNRLNFQLISNYAEGFNQANFGLVEYMNLVELKEGQATTTSLKVAEFFKKDHGKILRKIETLECSEEFAQANFGSGSYLDANSQPRPMYRITRDGFRFLVMGFTGKKAAKKSHSVIFNVTYWLTISIC